MASQELDEIALRNQPFQVILDKIDGLIKIKRSKGYSNLDRIKGLVAEISSSIRSAKGYYTEVFDRGDTVPELLEVLAQAFEVPNHPEMYKIGVLEDIKGRVIHSMDKAYVPLTYVNDTMRDLGKNKIKADFIKGDYKPLD